MQFDEKWAFVRQKEKNCDPGDDRRGDCWDHTAIDPETRLVVSLVVGKRTAEAVSEVVQDFHRRTGGRVMRLMTSDEYSAYVDAIRSAYGATAVPPRTGRPGRPRKPYTVQGLRGKVHGNYWREVDRIKGRRVRFQAVRLGIVHGGA